LELDSDFDIVRKSVFSDIIVNWYYDIKSETKKVTLLGFLISL
jgi:hypothetical protein